MEIDVTTLLVVTALQLVQNAQLYWLNRGQRRLSRTLIPPPMVPNAAYCQNCGNLHPSAELRHGLCAACLGGSPTAPPPFDGQHPGSRRRR